MPQLTTLSPVHVQPGATANALVNAAAVVKAAAGTIYNIIVEKPGTAGVLTVNNVASVGGAASANEVLVMPFGALTKGQIIPVNTACATGIVVSTVPNGAVLKVAYA